MQQDDDWDDDEDDGGSLYSNPNDNSNPGYDPNDPTAQHRQEGIRRDGEGDWQGALESFQAACRHNPDDAGGFNDLGVANMRVALKGIDIEKHLKASRAAYEMSGEMSGGSDENLQRNLRSLPEPRYEQVSYDHQALRMSPIIPDQVFPPRTFPT